MNDVMTSSRFRSSARRMAVGLVVGVLLAVTVACTDDAGTVSGRETDETVATDDVESLLGPIDRASGEPVRVGQVSEGSSAATEAADELRAGQATIEFLNERRGGIAGRPIELVTCEMKFDPALTTDCANQMIREEVVAVVVPQAAQIDALWGPLHEAGIPLLMLTAGGEDLLSDPDSTFMIINPASAFYGLPVALAEAEGADKVTFVLIDVPQAHEVINEDDGRTMERAGLDWDVVAVPPGTPDMTAQMQQVKDGGAGVVHILGNDAFCIAALQGLLAVGYEGAISGISFCFSDATIDALGADLEGINVLAPSANGATGDPSYELFLAVISEYGADVEDVDGSYALSGYAIVSTLAAALETLEGEVTPATVIETMKSMPETEMPAGAGMTFQCGGSAIPEQPAVCSNEWLRGVLDADGRPGSYTVEDSSDLVG